MVTKAEVLVRAAGPADVAAIVAVHGTARRAYYEAGGLAPEELESPQGPARRRTYWERALAPEGRTVLCAARGGDVLGVAAMSRAEGVVDLHHLHVLPDHWGQGIGGALHTAFVTYLRDASAAAGQLEVWERNDRAREFYARRGWRPDGHLRPGPGGAPYVRLRLAGPGEPAARTDG